MAEIILDKAEDLLAKCEVVTLASINELGYPRICVLSKNKADGIHTIWVSTGTNSTKTINFLKNPKASICYYSDGDSVTLLGNIQIISDMNIKKELWQDWYIQHFPKGVDDPEYCILRFDANEATCWIDGRFETHKIVV